MATGAVCIVYCTLVGIVFQINTYFYNSTFRDKVYINTEKLILFNSCVQQHSSLIN